MAPTAVAGTPISALAAGASTPGANIAAAVNVCAPSATGNASDKVAGAGWNAPFDALMALLRFLRLAQRIELGMHFEPAMLGAFDQFHQLGLACGHGAQVGGA